jgi:hypothetical protein
MVGREMLRDRGARTGSEATKTLLRGDHEERKCKDVPE